jgi:DNA polymerase-4/DNA polymerase V
MMNSKEKVILHVDGDSFFASCEISLNPSLRGRAVVTGQERGIATSMSQEAKALGISRGMPVYQIRKLFPHVVITHSNYGSYGIFAQRMYDIVRRHTPRVEEYSIDECFADLTGLVGPFRASEGPSKSHFISSKQAKLSLGQALKDSLYKELGMTFSIGIGPTKVLAKIASKHGKPNGLTVIEKTDIENFLKEYPLGKVWGIGPKTTRRMESLGMNTALEFIQRKEDWIRSNLSRPYLEIWHELQGTSVYNMNDDPDEDDYKSIQRTRTFTPPSSESRFILRELSRNAEGACARARAHNLASKRIRFFLKTQEFRYSRREIVFPNPLSNPNDIIREIRKAFKEVYKPNTLYRATGVTLSELTDIDHVQSDLFGASRRTDAWGAVFHALDKIDKKFGSKTIVLASSLGPGQRIEKRLRIPYMGEVL